MCASDVFFYHSLLHLLRQSFSLNLELTISTGLAGQPVFRIHLSPSLSKAEVISTRHFWLFAWMSGIPGLHASETITLPTEPSHQPTSCLKSVF